MALAADAYGRHYLHDATRWRTVDGWIDYHSLLALAPEVERTAVRRLLAHASAVRLARVADTPEGRHLWERLERDARS